MTLDVLKQIASLAGGLDKILQVSYDDGTSSFFIEPDDVLKESCLIKTSGDATDLLVVKGFLKNKETGLTDIPCTVYRTVADIRAVICIDRPSDRDKVRTFDVYSY